MVLLYLPQLACRLAGESLLDWFPHKELILPYYLYLAGKKMLLNIRIFLFCEYQDF